MSDLQQELRSALLTLPGVETRKMFGAEAFFVGPSMFAFFTPISLVLRLPHSAFAEALAHESARPFLSMGAAHLNGWAEVPLAGRTADSIHHLVLSAHNSGRHAARSTARRRRPARARRVRRTD